MKAFKFKLYRSHKNKTLQRQLDISCNVWNWCVAMQKKYYQLRESFLHKYRLGHWIVVMKRNPRHAHWNELMSSSVEDIVERIDLAYKAFWRNLKQGKKSSPPNFVRRSRYKSFVFRKPGNSFLKDGRIRINGVWYRLYDWREIEGKPKRVIVKKDPVGDFWVTIICDNGDDAQELTEDKYPAVGLDFGMKQFMTSSDGLSDIEAPLFLKESLAKLKRLSRKFSLKKQGSNNYERARKELVRLHRDITNKRDFFQWQEAGKLVNKYKVICIEDLNFKGMFKGRKKRWSRKLMDLAPYSFFEKLKYLAQKNGVRIVQVGRFYASSQTCHNCGHRCDITKDQSVREWTCPNCGMTLDRDRNAAINILHEGLRVLDTTLTKENRK